MTRKRSTAIATSLPEPEKQPEPLDLELAAEAAGSEPFRPLNRFIPSAFSKRLLAILRHAMGTGRWYVVAALSGDGKSTTLRWLRDEYAPVRVEGPDGRRVRHVPVLSTRVSSGVRSADKLMIALAHGLGVVPDLRMYRFREWLVSAIETAAIRLIVIDDAHELTLAQLSYLRELTDQLADRGCRPAVVLLMACGSTDPRTSSLWRMIVGRDLVPVQFARRLDGPDPIVFVEGLSRPELGRVLATYETHYRHQFPAIDLARWTSGVFGWLTDARIDVAKSRRVRMIHVSELVHAALAMAWARRVSGEPPAGPTGTDLRAAAIRLATRGSTFATLGSEEPSQPDRPEAAA